MNEGQLRDYFSRFGTLLDIYLPVHQSGRLKGFGFATFENKSGLLRVLEVCLAVLSLALDAARPGGLIIKDIRAFADPRAPPERQHRAHQQSGTTSRVHCRSDQGGESTRLLSTCRGVARQAWLLRRTCQTLHVVQSEHARALQMLQPVWIALRLKTV